LIDAFVEALIRGHESTPDTPSRTIHGSPHPHQWLDHCGRLALVDFDRLSLGPIEIDAATFVAELDFEKGGLRSEVAAFLAAYEKRVGVLDHRLLALYRAHKHFAKAFKAALAVETSREVRAAGILKASLAQLARGIA
jgi:aminoglycoside phosphotransferase (APT) family kinase protein